MKTITVLFFISILCVTLNCDEDVPQVDDLNSYLDTIGASLFYLVSMYNLNNASKTGIRPDNLRFAMVVTNVNLIKLEPQLRSVPAIVGSKLPGILSYIQNLTQRTSSDIKGTQIQNKEFISLIGIEELWELTLENFRTLERVPLSNDIGRQFMIEEAKEMSNVTHDVYYELCFNDLAKNFYRKRFEQCDIDLRCLKLLTTKRKIKGAELKIWLYFFTYNWYSCQCYIFTPSRDKEIINKICTNAYEEVKAVYGTGISSNTDDAMAKATLCTLLGYVQFLNRKWIATAIQSVQENGCYTKSENHRRRMMREKPSSKPKCYINNTALATAAMSLALRYELEKIPIGSGDALKYNETLNSIEKAAKYLESCQMAQSDVNTVFGTFLAYMNFKQMLIRHMNMKNDMKLWIEKMEIRLNLLKDKFITILPSQMFIVAHLLKDQNPWMQNLKDLRYERIKSNIRYMRLPSRAEVSAGISEINCILALSEKPPDGEKFTACNVPSMCLNQISKLSAIPLKAKLTGMMFSEFAKSCYLFSRFRDSVMKKEWCSMAFGQLQFIINRKVDLPGYLLELVVLCGHHGFQEFLAKNVTSHILLHQDLEGCFYDKKPTLEIPQNTRRKEIALCDPKTTLYGTALLAIAVRYIVQMNY